MLRRQSDLNAYRLMTRLHAEDRPVNVKPPSLHDTTIGVAVGSGEHGI